MDATQATTPVIPQQAAEPSAWSQDLVTALLGLWIIGGITADGWAHINVPALESFFTPWHGILYGGLLAFAAWVGWLGWQGRHAGRPWRAAWPAGYAPAAAGVALFAAGGIGDMVWHLIFGVEAGIDALVSPTHLVLLVGGQLMITTPIRAALHRHGGFPDGVAAGLPTTLALGAAATLAGFFLSYLSVFIDPQAIRPLTDIPEGAPGHQQAELPAIVGLGSYLVTSLVLIVPLLLANRYSPLPRGAVITVVAMVAVLGAALTDLRYVPAALGAVGGGLLAELVLIAAQRWKQSLALAIGVGIPLLVWPAQLAALAASEGLGWPVSMWAGVVMLTALAGLAVATLTKRPVRAAPA
jgi:hypothetical protein